MRAVQINGYGDRDILALHEINAPRPGPGEVRVRMAYSGVNFIDVYMRRGMYATNRAYATALPLTLGMDGSGVVEDTGPEVSGLTVGDRVAFCLSPGSYAEWAIVPQWKLVRVPDVISLEQAAAMMLQGCTAHYLTHSAFSLGAASTCLVHAGAGGVGQLLIQIAKRKGAVVFATVGSAEKEEVAKAHGADHLIFYEHNDFASVIKEHTKGLGVDVVYESVGQSTFAQSLQSLKTRGTCILFGASSGPVTSMNPQILADAGSLFLTRPNLADYMRDSAEIGDRVRDLFDMLSADHLAIDITRTFQLADVALAHQCLEERKSTGKILLEINADV